MTPIFYLLKEAPNTVAAADLLERRVSKVEVHRPRAGQELLDNVEAIPVKLFEDSCL